MKETKKNETFKRKSNYNPKRRSYVTEDGRLAYVVWEDDIKRDVTYYYEIGKNEVTEELVIMLDENDHDWDLSERYQKENSDYKFQNEQHRLNQDGNYFPINPIDTIKDTQSDPFDLLFPEDEITNELMTQLLEAMNKLSDAQKDLIYKHLGSMKRLEEIRKEEIYITGKVITQQALSNRWKKIIFRLCKAFDVPVPKKRKTQKDK